MAEPVSNTLLDIDSGSHSIIEVEDRSCVSSPHDASSVLKESVHPGVACDTAKIFRSLGSTPAVIGEESKLADEPESIAYNTEGKQPKSPPDSVNVVASECRPLDMKDDIVCSGTLCPICRATCTQSLEEHLAQYHICNYFIPAKQTPAYKRHMLKRVKDMTGLPEMANAEENVYVCRSCDFATKDINAVRFHLNIHTEVYQSKPGKVSCKCNQKNYSYPFHKWKHLLHSSSFLCNRCHYYFACENGLLSHLKAIHIPRGVCLTCNVPVSENDLISHSCLSLNQEEEQDQNQSEASIESRYSLSWNIFDNSLNYLDGKGFRLNTSSKVPDPSLDRRYLQLPIRNVENEAVVPEEVKLDPGKEITKYLKGKKTIKIANVKDNNEIVKNFHVAIQLELEKKLSRKGRRSQVPRAKREDDLFDVLGLGTVRSRVSVKQEAVESGSSGATPVRRGRSKINQEVLNEDADSPNLTRTRSGMQQPKEEEEEEGKPERVPFLEDLQVTVNGEWSKDHTYVCCSCGAGYLDLADMMDHKWESHPSVWCAHTMIQGQESIPLSFARQFQPPTSHSHKLPVPVPPATSLVTARRNSDANPPVASEKLVCSVCSIEFKERTSFHIHLVKCGGLSYASTSKKKNKKGFRFKRRKGQGVPNNRYGNNSQPSTPLKVIPGDKSSGLVTPVTDRNSQGIFQSNVVKRRLELAVGSIDNAELKNRLNAIISGSRKAGGNGAGPASRRTVRMKLRKKALETKRLKKTTRHSDRVKENEIKQQESVKEEPSKDKNGKEEPSKDKNGKEGVAKIPNKKGKEESQKVELKEDGSRKKEGNKNTKVTGGKKDLNEVEKEKISSKEPNIDSETEFGKKILRRRTSAEQEKETTVNILQTMGPKVEPVQKVGKKKHSDTSSRMSKGQLAEGKVQLAEGKEAIVAAGTSGLAKKMGKGKGVVAAEKMSKKLNGAVPLSDNLIEPIIRIENAKKMAQVQNIKEGKNKFNQISGDVPKTAGLALKKNNLKSLMKSVKNSKKKVKVKSKGSHICKPKQKSINLKSINKKVGLKSKSADEVAAFIVEANLKEAVKDLNKKGLKVLNEKVDAGEELASINFASNTPSIKAKGQDSLEGFQQEMEGSHFSQEKNATQVEEESDSESESEPEISRNFRTGRRCGGRMGLRNKRKLPLSRYSFRQSQNGDTTEGEETNEETRDSFVKPLLEDQENILPAETAQILLQKLAPTKKKRRRVGKYEEDDDFTYSPSGDSTDVEGGESSDEIVLFEPTNLRKSRRITISDSDSRSSLSTRRSSLQRRDSSLTSEGETVQDSLDESIQSDKDSIKSISNTSPKPPIKKVSKKKKFIQLLSPLLTDPLATFCNQEKKEEMEDSNGVLRNSEEDATIVRKVSKKRKARKVSVRANLEESEDTNDDLANKTSTPVNTKRKKVVPTAPPLPSESVSTPIPTKITPEEEEDEEDNIPLAILALGRSRLKETASNETSTIKGRAGEKKFGIVAEKPLQLKAIPRLVSDAGTADSESSGFEGFAPPPQKKGKKKVVNSKRKVAKSQVNTQVSDLIEVASPKPKRRYTVSSKKKNNKTEHTANENTANIKGKETVVPSTSQIKQKKRTTKTVKKKSAKNQSSDNPAGSVAQINDPNIENPDLKEAEAKCGNLYIESTSGSESSSGPYTTVGKMKRRRSSMEKIKDIPTRSSAIVVQESHTLEAHVITLDPQAIPGPIEHVNDIPPASLKNLPLAPKLKKRRTKSSPGVLPHKKNVTDKANISGNEVAAKSKKGKRATSISTISDIVVGNEMDVKILNESIRKTPKTPSKSPRKYTEGSRRKIAPLIKDGISDLQCIDCGLRFGSVTSLEDHREECVTIAFEMSLMEAEDHLFECPHCHLTFAMKGTQKKHTTSCRLAKSKKNPHRSEANTMRRINRNTPALDPQRSDSVDAHAVPLLYQTSPVKARRRSKENVASDASLNPAASPLRDSCKQNAITVSELSEKSDIEKQLDKSKKNSTLPCADKGSSKMIKEMQTNGQLDNLNEELCHNIMDGFQKCSVCGYEVTDKESSKKHQLLQQFNYQCQQRIFVELCGLVIQYNLTVEALRTLIVSTNLSQGSTVLNLDTKLQKEDSSTNSNAIQLKDLLTSPHCTWITNILDTVASHHRTTQIVTISGSRQEVLKSVTAMEELLKEMSDVENTMKKNQMLQSMRETFEAGMKN